MRAINDKCQGPVKPPLHVSRAPSVKKKLHRAMAAKTRSVSAASGPGFECIAVEYPRAAFELLSKHPNKPADCCHAEDDDL